MLDLSSDVADGAFYAISSMVVCSIWQSTRRSRTRFRDFLSPRQPSFVSAHALAISRGRLTGDDMLFVPLHNGRRRRRRRLCFTDCWDFLIHQTTGLQLCTSSTSGKPKHAQRYDALRFEPYLPSFRGKQY